jgi:hypothetical protein
VRVGIVEEFADGVPVGTGTLAELRCFRVTDAGEEDVADVAHRGGFAGGNGLGCDGFLEIAEDLKDVHLVEMFESKWREMAGGILGVGQAVQGLEMGWAEAIAVVGGVSAVAAIGEGETAEGKFGRVAALAGHRESIAKNTDMSIHRVGTTWANLMMTCERVFERLLELIML